MEAIDENEEIMLVDKHGNKVDLSEE